jgi:hypothetical protein
MAQTQQRRSANGSRTRTSSANGSGPGPAEALKHGAQNTTRAARKSGTPAIAAGAALAGLAAGAALASRGRSVFGLLNGAGGGRGTAGTLLRASQQLNSATCSLNDLAGEIRKVRELAQAGQSRSPIEVVLQGLTRRPEQ